MRYLTVLLMFMMCGAQADNYPLDRDSCGGYGNIMADVASAKAHGIRFLVITPMFEAHIQTCVDQHGAANCVGGTESERQYVESNFPKAWEMAGRMSEFEVGKYFFNECMSHHKNVPLPNGIKPTGPQIES